ncbi:MAG: hypothetical protein GF368_01630 [Candidatus Aenigmarchaeota archaeon]|nr:hypothetical protein [Candidatus Aenigmarchaeota archaeon]
MKAQMSLQMMVAVVILMVVSLVIIRYFLGQMEFVEPTEKDFKGIIRDMGFESKCEDLCNEYKLDSTSSKLAEFCYHKLDGDDDLNNNGIIDSFPANTKVLPVCEDSVYCFHVVECEDDSGTVDWDDCRQATCEHYEERYQGDTDKADGKMMELFPNEGGCNLPEGENWWEMYFGPMACTFPPNVVGLKDCIYDGGTDELTCLTNIGYSPGYQIVVVLTDTDADPVCAAVINEDGSQIIIRPDGTEISLTNAITFPGSNDIVIEGLVSRCSPIDTNRDGWFVFLVSTAFDPDFDLAYVQGVG